MVYSTVVDASRTHFIIISSNYDSSSANLIGSKINIKTFIPRSIDFSNNCYKFDDDKKVYNKSNFSDEVFKNRVILSSTVITTNNSESYKICLLTQQNLFHNIKFIQKNNDFQQPRILFTKYNVTNNITNTNQYLLNSNNNEITNNNTNINLNNNLYNIHNDTSDIEDYKKFNILKRLVYYFNIYKPYQNSDYYKLKFSDFIDLSFINNSLDKNSLKFDNININLTNDFSSNNLINYNEDDFNKFYILDISDSSPIIKDYDSDTDTDISFDTNILLYNKLDNISTINCQLNTTNTFNTVDKDMSLNFFVTKGVDYISKEYGKIYLTNNSIYLNSRVLGYENNFYSNNSTYFNESDNNNMIYLSLGNAITGITQKNLYKNMKLNEINKIYFRNLTDSNNIYSSEDYLLNQDYNYNYTNILNIIRRQLLNSKITQLNINNIYHNYNLSLNHNIYNHTFNSSFIKIKKQTPYSGTSQVQDVITNYNKHNNNFIIANEDDINLNQDFEIKLIGNNNRVDIKRFNSNLSIISNNTGDYVFKTNTELSYNFLKNYDLNANLDILYSFNYNDATNNFNISYLNFHKIILTSNFIVGLGSDFTNIDCIFVYHPPDSKNTPDEFKYPYNNIQIISSDEIDIDTLNKAIELLPGARTSVTNSVFIPPKNGSNLSRKKIQGFIGLNNTGALLSIKPYDENFIIGRGFINQYQITDNCKSDIKQIEEKLNSQKHISVKNLSVNNLNLYKETKRKNFANIVRNRKLNQRNQICRTDPASIKKYTTPFTNPLWKK